MIVNSGNLQLLNRAYSAAFNEGFGQAPADHDVLTMDVPSMTAVQEYGWLGQFPGLTEWVGERVLKGIAEHGYVLRNRKFESTVEVGRDAIEDDQHGVYTPLMREMGRAAAAHPCELVFEALLAGFWTTCYDGQYLLDSDHPVGAGTVSNVGGAPVRAQILSGGQTPWFLVDGSRAIKPILFQRRRDYRFEAMDRLEDEHVFSRDAFRYGVDARCSAGYGLWQLVFGSVNALTPDNYDAARQALHEMRGDQGRQLGVMPTHLIVPPSLEKEALEILNADRNSQGATNVWRGTATPLVTPWLAR